MGHDYQCDDGGCNYILEVDRKKVLKPFKDFEKLKKSAK